MILPTFFALQTSPGKSSFRFRFLEDADWASDVSGVWKARDVSQTEISTSSPPYTKWDPDSFSFQSVRRLGRVAYSAFPDPERGARRSDPLEVQVKRLGTE